MDGLGYALDNLGIGALMGQSAATVMFETDSRCRQLLVKRRQRPGVSLSAATDSASSPKVAGSVFALTDDDCGQLSMLMLACPRLRWLLVAGGSPCVGFSGANPGGRGIDDPESNKLWVLPVLATRARACRPDVKTIFLAENVEMGPRAPPLDKVFGVEVLHLCASRLLPCCRPRIYITNLVPPYCTDKVVDPSSILEPGWRPLWELLGGSKAPLKFGTFLRSFPPGKPTEFPADYPRLPLSCYNERGLVYRPDAPPPVLDSIRALVTGNMRISTDDLKKNGGKAVALRAKVADFIHKGGGIAHLRPLSSSERDRALGFPEIASSIDDAPDHGALDWGRMDASGNSFAVAVVEHILSPLADHILRDAPLPLRSGFPSVPTAAAALKALGASSAAPLNPRR